jgi:hypothetical protein
MGGMGGGMGGMGGGMGGMGGGMGGMGGMGGGMRCLAPQDPDQPSPFAEKKRN